MSSHKKKLLSGAKFNGRHSTVISAATDLLKTIKKDKNVTKIVLSIITPASNAPLGIKLVPVQAGFRLVVRGRTAIQTFFVYTTNPEETKKIIQDYWTSTNG